MHLSIALFIHLNKFVAQKAKHVMLSLAQYAKYTQCFVIQDLKRVTSFSNKTNAIFISCSVFRRLDR